ncbi:MAG: hypothetical protein FK732_13035 [Asgard group archaeon]|nr:hypothetical protein [Asgard group archaeon]
MVELTISIMLQFVQTTGIIVGIIYYITIMRNQQKANQQSARARQRELIYQKYQSYTKEYFQTIWQVNLYDDWKTPQEFLEKHGPPNNVEDFANYSYTMRHFELAGILYMENETESDLIFKLYPPMSIMQMWERYEPVIMWTREKRNDPGHLASFQYLYTQAKKRYPDILPQSFEFNIET